MNGVFRSLLAAVMANLTIKNVLEPLVQKLKRMAVMHRRSLNLEVIACLGGIVQSVPLDPESILARARKLRRTPVAFRLTDRTLAQLKAARRP